MRYRHAISTLLLLVATSTTPVRAELPLDSIADDGARTALRNIGLQLVFGSYPAAMRNAENFSWNIFNLGKKGIERELAYALALQAVAEASTGLARDASWHWESAQILLPELRYEVMRSYSEIVDVFDTSPFNNRQSAIEYLEEKGLWLVEGQEYAPPVAVDRISAPMPHKRASVIAGEKITVSFLVGTDGRVYSPQVESEGNSSLATFSALEVLNRWVYRPATGDGEPIFAPARATFTFQKHK
ncbi:MAG: hypothetical protein P8Y44_03285 [Acidobacteriota bacterium]